MQDKETSNSLQFTDVFRVPLRGRIVALDPGTKKAGIAVCDELQLTVRRVGVVDQRNWKTFLKKIRTYLAEFDAKALVIGLPYNFDGSESEMSLKSRSMRSDRIFGAESTTGFYSFKVFERRLISEEIFLSISSEIKPKTPTEISSF